MVTDWIVLSCTDFEVADEVLASTDSNVGWLSHVVAAVEPLEEFATLRNHEDGRWNAVHSHDVSWKKPVNYMRQLISKQTMI